MDVTWTDPSKQRTRAIGQHDVYLLAVDKSILLLQGDNDFTLSRVRTAPSVLLGVRVGFCGWWWGVCVSMCVCVGGGCLCECVGGWLAGWVRVCVRACVCVVVVVGV